MKKRRLRIFNKKKKGPRRKVRKSLIVLILLLFVSIFLLFYIPKTIDNGKLKKLGYSSEEIVNIREYKLTKTLIKNNWYSDNLALAIRNKSFKKDYLELYLNDNDTNEKDLLLYNRLLDKGYSKEVILRLFKELKFYEITPLLVFDTQEDISVYIEDVLSHQQENSEDKFILTNSYLNPYENTLETNTDNINMLVNKKRYLTSDYSPSQVTPLDVKYAAKDLNLSLEAAKALYEWCDKAISLQDEFTKVSPVRFYAVSAYRTYETQESLYNNYVRGNGVEQADTFSARAGFSEHQTGLAVDLAAVGSEGLSEFKETQAYLWCIENSQDFGWILRYPENKKSITGYDFEAWHFRYVGTDLAIKVKESKLTYDEYYALYLDSWTNPLYEYTIE